MTKEQSKELKEQGYTIIRNQIDEKWLDLLSNEMDKAFQEHRSIQLYNKNDINSSNKLDIVADNYFNTGFNNLSVSVINTNL